MLTVKQKKTNMRHHLCDKPKLKTKMKKTTFIKVIIGSLISINAYCQSPVDENGALSVNGSHIVNEDGDIVSFAGNSLFWSMAGQNAGSYEGEAYYNADVVTG